MWGRKNHVLVAMSGGVDSSVAVYLLQQEGFVCEGITMRMYRNEIIGRAPEDTQKDLDDAGKVAAQMAVPHDVLDATKQFQTQVMEKMIRVYEAGGTPNPCIDCNRHMKFGQLLQVAKARDLAYVATGHYARIVQDPETGRYLLKKARDSSKDQSYVLYTLTQEQLAHLIFPLGEKEKPEIRALAEQLGFANAQKHDSQDICFIPDGDYAAFMERYTGKQYPPGAFLDLDGNEVGSHRGAVRYTLGQRKGLGLAMGVPVYVCGKDMGRNTVSVGPESALFATTLLADDVNWISVARLDRPMRVKAKVRYRQAEQWATVYPDGETRVRVEFDVPQRAITWGQAVVFYDDDTVVGGGTIAEVLPQTE